VWLRRALKGKNIELVADGDIVDLNIFTVG
jgi:hypothetical protein